MRQSLHIAANYFPIKQGWDALALGRLLLRPDLSSSQKISCLRFYFDNAGINPVMASLTRSGSHWSLLGLTLAMDLAEGGSGNYGHIKGKFVPSCGFRYSKLDWRFPSGEVLNDPPSHTKPVILHTHHPYFRVRSTYLKKMRIVVLLRDIVGSMESKFFKLAGTPDLPTEEDDEAFSWSSLTEDSIEFFNSWGEVMKWHPNCRLFRYEDLLADPAQTHKEIADFWGLGIPDECIERAFELVTKDRMKAILNTTQVTHQTEVSFRKKNERVPGHRLLGVYKALAERVVHDFGYGYREKYERLLGEQSDVSL